MATPATINVRHTEQLKEHGGQVPERSGVLPSEIVRSVYRYMEKNQEIPPYLDVASPAGPTAEDKRRAQGLRACGQLVSPRIWRSRLSGAMNRALAGNR